MGIDTQNRLNTSDMEQIIIHIQAESNIYYYICIEYFQHICCAQSADNERYSNSVDELVDVWTSVVLLHMQLML